MNEILLCVQKLIMAVIYVRLFIECSTQVDVPALPPAAHTHTHKRTRDRDYHYYSYNTCTCARRHGHSGK